MQSLSNFLWGYWLGNSPQKMLFKGWWPKNYEKEEIKKGQLYWVLWGVYFTHNVCFLQSLIPEIVVLAGVTSQPVWLQLLRICRLLRSLKLFARFHQVRVIILALVRALKVIWLLQLYQVGKVEKHGGITWNSLGGWKKAIRNPVKCCPQERAGDKPLCSRDDWAETRSECLVGDLQGGPDWAAGGNQPSLAQLWLKVMAFRAWPSSWCCCSSSSTFLPWLVSTSSRITPGHLARTWSIMSASRRQDRVSGGVGGGAWRVGERIWT